MRAVLCGLAVAAGLAGAGPAQDLDVEAEAAAMLALVADEARQVCADAPQSGACGLARGRAVAIVANAIAEAGQTRDRGAFIELVRAYLASEAPELRSAAAYALAKMAPDRTDTPRLVGLLRDRVSAVRDGAWAAAAASSDPQARLAADRFPERPGGASLSPDPAPFDPATLGLTLPEAAEYAWLSAAARKQGELQFLSDARPETLVAGFAAQAGQDALTLDAARTAWPEAAATLAGYSRAPLFASVQVVPVFGADAADKPPELFALVYLDRLFGGTGFALVYPDGRNLLPKPAPPAAEIATEIAAALPPLDPQAFDAALLAKAAVQPAAPAEETDLILAIRAAGGVGAQDYLDLFPDGAYAADARAMVAGPRLELEATRIAETAPVTARLVNLPAGTTGRLTVQDASTGGFIASAWVDDAAKGPVTIDIAGRAVPGVYQVRAEVQPPEAADPVVLWHDFSVELALATLRVDKTVFAPGETIQVHFSGLSGSDQDYVCTAAAGASNAHYLAYSYAGGAREGTLTLAAPSTPGAYELRAFFDEDETVLRASLPITVAGTPAVTPVPETPVPPAGGPADSARATLVLDQTTYAPGATITVTYSGMFGDASDYLCTTEAGSSNGRYLTYKYTEAARQGTLTLVAPAAPGAYEVRAFFREDEAILRGSVPFTVE
ncbi:hypothetical protein LHP98_14215 [Rhodobacter sp. Har01]|uniref:hypothetical protein n=1 Tax=Rhodobacter sp. Har01 TaxID=2883999 RepID=UPI001D05D1DB|nr:hypothetical protein [Rhodobacter sp. Har01]MCB6179275.1 hypothetical protein [Rhodobacter sp. Har01]